ncbi:uncharacterized protein BDR25DRAFT_248480 [Lindgomyces ingoldianus]|uniref:Uncharacterized protein n=1 Tax=Lindgomyces ingoldianus TaxID=673940 RepID=A0ACB6Q8Y2_9PLEO|nr:uncharacterized protein BDR25DRAFT_248480 [Lindgomyces ingoldianus]KAF2462621.1 hypothetical protein BDR25DRAFT_248480 [Lindgomyces ingoldianus]
MKFDTHIHPKTPAMSLDAAGLIALADLTTVQERTALTGTSSLLDLLVLVPGIHLQQRATDLHNGEYPARGALTTGYVFRVENPATVYYLQKVGRTGHLTTLKVTKLDDHKQWWAKMASKVVPLHNLNFVSGAAYFMAVSWGIVAIILMALARDWWGIAVVGILIGARAINAFVISRRSNPGWFGRSEGNENGDLLILLSQDRWIRMKGLVDHLKAVTSGQWLRDESTFESRVTAIATVTVYLAAALASNIHQFGKILLLALLIGSVGLLAIANTSTDELQMHGHLVKVAAQPKAYKRRLDLANDLITETGRDDWAVRMGMIVKNVPSTDTERAGKVVM